MSSVRLHQDECLLGKIVRDNMFYTIFLHAVLQIWAFILHYLREMKTLTYNSTLQKQSSGGDL